MYMNTRANLDYWSTDNCCMRWSLKTGTLTIGFLSLVWQALMVTVGVMMIVKCPVFPLNDTLSDNMTEIEDFFDGNLTFDNLSPYDGPYTLLDTQPPSTIFEAFTPTTTTTINSNSSTTLDTYTPVPLNNYAATVDPRTPVTITTTTTTTTLDTLDKHSVKIDPYPVSSKTSTTTLGPQTTINTTTTILNTSYTTIGSNTPNTTTTTTTVDIHTSATTLDTNKLSGTSDTQSYTNCDTNCTTVCDTSCDKNDNTSNNNNCNITNCSTTCDTTCNLNRCNTNRDNCTQTECTSTAGNCNMTTCSTVCDTNCNATTTPVCNTTCSTSCDTNCSATCNITEEDTSYLDRINFTCLWLPGPEVELIGIYNNDKLLLVAGIFLTYSGIYFLLSFCVIVGVVRDSVPLLHGWVAFTGFHNLVILAFLLVPLPFTTLPHLLFTIAHFILSLYTWAVVKSYRHKLEVALKKPLLPEGSITDFTVDGVDVSEIPVQV